MFRWIFRFINDSIPVRFVSPYLVQESVTRLSSAVAKPLAFHPGFGQYAAGTVTAEKVRIHRVIPLVGNNWKPYFYGSFSATESGAVLEGAFKFSVFARVFLTIGFGIIVLMTLISIMAVLTMMMSISTKSPGDFLFLLFVVGISAAWIGMVRVEKWLSRNDVAWISRVIATALATKGVEYLPQQVDR